MSGQRIKFGAIAIAFALAGGFLLWRVATRDAASLQQLEASLRPSSEPATYPDSATVTGPEQAPDEQPQSAGPGVGASSRLVPTAIFSEPSVRGPDYVAIRDAADEMLSNVDDRVVAYSTVLRIEPSVMGRFLHDALNDPESFAEHFDFGLPSALGSCPVKSVTKVRKLDQIDPPHVYRIATSCESAAGTVQITIRYDSVTRQIAATLTNPNVDVKVAPIENTQFALVFETVKGTLRSDRLPADV
jgi:hypothetical protein